MRPPTPALSRRGEESPRKDGCAGLGAAGMRRGGFDCSARPSTRPSPHRGEGALRMGGCAGIGGELAWGGERELSRSGIGSVVASEVLLLGKGDQVRGAG